MQRWLVAAAAATRRPEISATVSNAVTPYQPPLWHIDQKQLITLFVFTSTQTPRCLPHVASSVRGSLTTRDLRAGGLDSSWRVELGEGTNRTC
jgi:hypothetical protein